jgi:hypothetical protein
MRESREGEGVVVLDVKEGGGRGEEEKKEEGRARSERE